jgi:fatty-acyl-CoA synthase
VLAGLEAINTGIDLRPTDSGGFWIPLFHDMGLFGTISGILAGLPMHLWSPADFVKRPDRWLREFLASGATITAMPNFAYDYLVAAMPPEEAAELDMSRWRVSFNGADSISAKSVEAFLDRFAPSGFRPEAMFQVYGMAEATLAVTFPPLGRAPRFDWVDRDVLAESGRVERVSLEMPRARGVASVGRPVVGIDLRIVDPATGSVTGEDTVGEIQIRGLPVTSGYLSADAADADPMTHDGWLPTGDLAYLHDGEVFVTGRIKEMIKHRGASFYPQDVEAVAKAVSGIYKGRCVAVAGFGTEGQEDMLVVAETDLVGEAASRLTADLRHRIQADLGLAQIDVCLVAPSSLPRTSSGKFQRLAARELVRQSVN